MKYSIPASHVLSNLEIARVQPDGFVEFADGSGCSNVDSGTPHIVDCAAIFYHGRNEQEDFNLAFAFQAGQNVVIYLPGTVYVTRLTFTPA